NSFARLLPLAKTSVAFMEFGFFHETPVFAHAIDHAHFVAVLEISADARQIDAHADAVFGQLLARADARELEQLWRIKRAAAKNHFTRSASLPALAWIG